MGWPFFESFIGWCAMYRIIVLLITWFLLFDCLAPFAANCAEGAPRVVWQVPSLGDSSAELQLGPNGLYYLSFKNKLAVVDDSGRKLLEATRPTGSGAGRPVFDPYGSIFLPGGTLLQEIKLNGSSGWNFTVYQDKSSAAAQLTTGPGNLLYLPLPSALYAVDTVGHYKWMMLQWESEDANRSMAVSGREILACAGNDKAVFTIYGNKGEGFTLVAVNGEGKIHWRCWLGDIKAASLVSGPDDRIYVSVNLSKVESQNWGMVYAFDSDGDGSCRWRYTIKEKGQTALTLSEHGLLYLCAGEKLIVLNQADGTEAWYEPLYKAISQPAVDEISRRVYLGTDDKRLLAVTPQGRLDWDLVLDGKVTGKPLVSHDGYIYVMTSTGTLYKIADELPVSTGG